jgi:pilus assembly protein CpaB
MRMKSLVLIFIALGCGLVASIGISQVLSNSKPGQGTIEMEPILVTTKEIDINSSFDAQNVKLEPWPKMKLPEGAIRSLDELKDKYARQRFIKGEPILKDKITDQQGVITPLIPMGFRVMPVKVDEETVMKGIAPGDRVDINLSVKRSEEISEPGTYTIMQAVRIFAVGSKVEKDIDPKGTEAQFRTVSLLVTPEQMRHLTGAAQIGKIGLALRNPNEPIDESGKGVTPLSEILRGRPLDSGETTSTAHLASIPADQPPAENHNSGPSLLQMLGEAMKTAATNIKNQPEAEAQTGYTMHIYTNNEVKQYQWHSRDGMPQESTVFTAAGSSGGSAPASAPAAVTGPNHRPSWAPGGPGYLLERRPSWMTETAR